MRIEVLRTEEDLAPVLDAWHRLRLLPEHEPDAYRAALRERGADPYVVALTRDGRLVALLAGRVERGHVPLKLGYWTALRLPVRRIVIPPHGILGSGDEADLRALVEQLVADLRARRADLAVVEFAGEGSAALRAARGVPVGFWMRDRVRERRIHRRLDLPATFKEYDKGHKGLLQKVRKFEKVFAGRFEHALLTREEEIPAFCAAAGAVAGKAYQRALGEGFLDGPGDRALLLAAARMGGLRAFTTSVDGKLVAFWAGCRTGTHARFWWTAYDAAYQEYSPGLVSSARMVERLIAEGVVSLDFGGGDASYKERLCNAASWEESVRIFAPGPRGAVAGLLAALDAAIGNLARTHLKGLANRLKTPWRRFLARRLARSQGKADAPAHEPEAAPAKETTR